MRGVARLLLFAQLSLLFFLFVCFLLIPHFLLEADEGGVSNYGTYAKTVVPFTLGLGLCGVLTIWAACSLPKKISMRRSLRAALCILGILYLLVLVSTYPYKLDTTFDNIHVYAGLVTAVYSMIMGVWLAAAVARDAVNLSLLLAQFAGFVLTGLTYFGYLHMLFVAEFLTSAAFGGLLVRAVSKAVDNANSPVSDDSTYPGE